MSKQQYTLNVASRAATGRSASRRLRKTNQIPAILYGKHTNPETLAVDAPEFGRLLKAIAGSASLIELKRQGASTASLSFLQEVQRDPITDKYLHVDLQEVKADEKMEIRVRVHTLGESFGVKNQSGVLEATQALRIRCFPKDLPPFIEVDVTELKVGETIKVSGLKAIAGVDFLDDKNQPVVSCVAPLEEEVAVAATPAAGAAAAPAADGKAAAAPAADAKAAAAAPAKGAAPAKPAAPAKK